MKERPDDTLALAEKLELARTAVREFHAQCFWYMRADLDIKPSDLKEIARGLRQNGGRRGFLLAAKLCR
jgi:hypothetical protein